MIAKINNHISDFNVLNINMDKSRGKFLNLLQSDDLVDHQETDITLVSTEKEDGKQTAIINNDNGISTTLCLSRISEENSSIMRVASANSFNEALNMINQFNDNEDAISSVIGSHYLSAFPVSGDVICHGSSATGYCVEDYGHAIKAVEGKESTPESPIVYVAARDKDRGNFAWYKVSVNHVNPSNATREEMFAYILYTYKDDPDALFTANETFKAIEQYGLERGLFSTDQNLKDYLALFRRSAIEFQDFINNKIVVHSQYSDDEEVYNTLLKIIDNMTEHIDILDSERFSRGSPSPLEGERREASV